MTLTEDQIDLIARTCVKPRNRNPTNDEVALFVAQVERTGLDPFARQIYAQFRSNKGVEKLSIETSIDGFRLVAERTGKYMGQDEPQWCGDDGVWTDTWLKKELPKAAKVTVRKVMGNLIAPTSAVAHWSEYAVTGPAGRFWESKPALMISKCAEALALRKAFPQELSGLYTAEEMAQADEPTVSVAGAADSLRPSEPQIKFLKSLLTKSKATADDIRLLYLEITGRELAKGRKFQDEVSRDECSRAIERLKEGAIPTAANPDLPPPADGEFVHEKVSAEDFIEAFPGTVEEPAA